MCLNWCILRQSSHFVIVHNTSCPLVQWTLSKDNFSSDAHRRIASNDSRIINKTSTLCFASPSVFLHYPGRQPRDLVCQEYAAESQWAPRMPCFHANHLLTCILQPALKLFLGGKSHLIWLRCHSWMILRGPLPRHVCVWRCCCEASFCLAASSCDLSYWKKKLLVYRLTSKLHPCSMKKA